MKSLLGAAALAAGIGLILPAAAQSQPNDAGRNSPLAQLNPGKASPLAQSPCKGSRIAQVDSGRDSPLAQKDPGQESPLAKRLAQVDSGKDSPLASADGCR